jgi:transposase
VLAGHTGLVDDLLGRGVTNSQVICERLVGQGYRGGLTSVKAYVAAHMGLVPARRRAAAPQGSRRQRFVTGPGEAYQMDWGFVTVAGPGGAERRIACFAMVCHHCGSSHVEFFPNARQENLLIGMAHAFMAMGVPDEVPADNMKSVVVRRDLDGRPVWQRDYAEFMGCVGFRTRLCKPRHPLAKGKVERPVRFARDNFLAGRDFTDIAAPDEDAALRCAFDRACAELLFDVIDRRYEKEGQNTMIPASNVAPSSWGEFLAGDDALLCALDRVFGKASVFMMRGLGCRSRRLDTYSVEAVPQATKAGGMQPKGV